jgi:hypothetical protein
VTQNEGGIMAQASKGFSLAKYQVQSATKIFPVTIEATGDTFEVTVKQLSWSKRNQLISKCLNWSQTGTTSFDGDMYIRESLKEMIVDAPWGRTTEAFLISIDERLGSALEAIVPKAFGAEDGPNPDAVKKE